MDLSQVQQLITNAISDNNVHIQQMIKDANEHNTIYQLTTLFICKIER